MLLGAVLGELLGAADSGVGVATGQVLHSTGQRVYGVSPGEQCCSNVSGRCTSAMRMVQMGHSARFSADT